MRSASERSTAGATSWSPAAAPRPASASRIATRASMAYRVMPDRTSGLGGPPRPRAGRSDPYDPAVRLRLAACIAALVLGLIGLVTASVRVGRLLLIGQGEGLLVPASAALVALGVGGIVLLLAARRRRTAVAALGV